LGGLCSEGGEATGTEQATQAADFKAAVIGRFVTLINLHLLFSTVTFSPVTNIACLLLIG